MCRMCNSPPSTGKTVPVIQDAAGEKRNTAALAISAVSSARSCQSIVKHRLTSCSHSAQWDLGFWVEALWSELFHSQSPSDWSGISCLLQTTNNRKHLPRTNHIRSNTPWTLFYRNDSAQRVYSRFGSTDMCLPRRTTGMEVCRDVNIGSLGFANRRKSRLESVECAEEINVNDSFERSFREPRDGRKAGVSGMQRMIQSRTNKFPAAPIVSDLCWLI